MSMGSQFKESVLASIRVERMVQTLNAQIEELRRETMKLMDERDKMRQERDEARRELCKHYPFPQKYAIDAGWDCFRESPLDRLATMDEENGL